MKQGYLIYVKYNAICILSTLFAWSDAFYVDYYFILNTILWGHSVSIFIGKLNEAYKEYFRAQTTF
jgi:hypothetical protein